MSLQLHRPTPDGSVEPAPVVTQDYRRRLKSRRWSAAELANPDVHTTNPWLAVGLIALISAATFVLLVLGYASHFWGG
jgi:hypothetical protein